MKTVTQTALANLKQNKGRNILIGIAICLTTILLFVVTTVGSGIISLQFKAVNTLYPTWHIMYRNAGEATVQALKQHADIGELGVRQDVATMALEDKNVFLIYEDESAITLNKIELEEGDFPQSKSDIVVSKGLLEVMGNDATIGDTIEISYQIIEPDGLSLAKEGEFRISGFYPDTELAIENKSFSGLVSKEFMEEMIPEQERDYRVMFRIAQADKMTTDDIKALARNIAADFGIDEPNVVENSEYLMANYIDPAFYTGVAVILLVIVLAGIITIYSIYYVSMIQKVQEFGKIKALGATKKQVKQIVFREGLFVACIAIPIGLLVGCIASYFFINVMIGSVAQNANNILNAEMTRIIRAGEINLFLPWIFLLSIVVSFLTVVISLRKPMVKASKISPVEAMRYTGENSSRRKTRKGYMDLSLFKLTKANLARNKKRTAITIVTLGMTGILFIIVATVLSCANPKEIAKELILSDYKLYIEDWSGDKMNPQREWTYIQQNNPLTEKMKEEIEHISGVAKVQETNFLSGALEDYMDEDQLWTASIAGLGDEFAKDIEKGIISGSVTYEELKKGDKIILQKRFLYWFPEVKVGDIMNMILYSGDNEVKKSFEIAAIGDYPRGFSGNDFILPSSVIEELNEYNTTYSYNITVSLDQVEEVGKKLEDVVENYEMVILDSYEDKLDEWNGVMSLLSTAGYAFMIILGAVGIMNLINTIINSLYTRKKELGVMQAIGLSEHQLTGMLQLEGAFYTVGTLIVSLGIGNLAGYLVFLRARATGILNITKYHYPVTQTILLIAVVSLLQIILTLVISRNFKKQSLTERIRSTE